ncbi:MAG: hypothetical protein ABH858_06715 [Candidatus Omnitrophota bacterium]
MVIIGQFTINSTSSVIDIDVTRLPVRHDIKGARGLGLFFIVFSSLWGGVPTFFLVQSIREGKFEPEMFFILIFSIIGTALFLFGLNQFFIKGLLAITQDTVSLSRSSLFGSEKWREFFHSYQGVLYRSEYHSGSKNRSSYTLYILELFHKHKAKTILLYQSLSSQDIRKKWEDYSRALGLPAIEKEDGKIIKRDAADLDKSIQELVKEKKIEVEYINIERPPAGISVKSEQDMICIDIHKKSLPPLAAIFMVFFPFIFIYIGFFVEGAPFIFGIFGILFEITFVAVILWSIISMPQLRISHQDVHLVYITPWKEIQSTKLPRKSIEQVLIKGYSDNRDMSKAVVINSDSGTIRIGDGLSGDSLHWLKQCIIRSLS